MRNSHKTGVHRRIISLPSAASVAFEEQSRMITSSSIEQAVLLWLDPAESCRGTSPSSESNTSRPSHPLPVAPSICAGSVLRFVPHNDNQKVMTSHSGDGRVEPERLVIPIWTQPSTAHADNQSDQTLQNPYVPPTISVELQNATNNHISKGSRVTHALPVFDLYALLGESCTSKLHTLSQSNQVLADAFGLSRENEASGWVMVKGGYGTEGFKTLVHEVWRLWLFVGGRGRREDGREDEDEWASREE